MFLKYKHLITLLSLKVFLDTLLVKVWWQVGMVLVSALTEITFPNALLLGVLCAILTLRPIPIDDDSQKDRIGNEVIVFMVQIVVALVFYVFLHG